MLRITLKDVREACGFTLNAAAAKIGISSDVMERYEDDTGSIPARIAAKISCLYKVSIDFIEGCG